MTNGSEDPTPAAGEPGVGPGGEAAEPLSLGIDRLDSALGGGVQPGDLVAIVAPPTSQSERLLYATAAANPARYCATLRPAVEVEESMAAVGLSPAAEGDGPADGGIEVTEVGGDALLDDPVTHLSGLVARSAVIVDPATELERAGEDRYRSFLADLKRHLRATESVGVFHCLRAAPRPLRRDLTLARADVTMEVTRTTDAGGTETHLSVGKVRRGRAPTDRFTLSFADEVTVDSHRRE
jgi:hypothetical protein